MGKEMKNIVWAVVIITAIAALLGGWWYWPQIRFRSELSRLAVDAKDVPAFRGKLPGEFGVDTFSDDVSSANIGSLYYMACDRLERLRGSYPRRTFHWKDGLGWDRVTSVVQFPTGHISVTAANNNDNDSVNVQVVPGVFPPPSRSSLGQFLELKELPNDRLPAGMLRQ